MRVKRNRSVTHDKSGRHGNTRRTTPGARNGIPKLSLWEVGVGAVWK